MKKTKVAILISGGVDSSVALRLLLEKGYDVTAFYLKIWLEDELSYLGNCPWQEDLSYVQKVCDQAGVKLEIISFQREYWDEVVKYTISEIKAGRTPNPDIMCNQRVKFGAFYKKISNDFDYVATGHYAQINRKNGEIFLQTSPDLVKDQTYFLSHLSKEQLSRALFPIGNLSKAEVRKLAEKYNLPNKNRKDSQGICFLGKLKFREFIKHYMGEKKGDIIEFETKNKVGQHNGFWFYTIGQRQGLGLSGGPWYVVSKDIKNNLIFISKKYYSPEKERNNLTITSCNWIQKPVMNKELKVKLRHGSAFNKGVLTKINENDFAIELNQRDQGISSGQFAVIYDNNICIGSGVIK